MEIREGLEDHITMEELQRAMGGMKPGKAPGPDGFTLQYYQALLPLLGPHMVRMFNGLGDGATLPRDTLRAHISLIPKESKDPSACGSYRPISLLNLDLKLFTKILANRLTQFMPDLIHLDQVGFIPAREARDNTTKVLNLIHIATKTKVPCVFRAFDHVNWDFMTSVLKHIGLGHKMLQWIHSIQGQWNPARLIYNIKWH